ncbi:Os08g0392300 [Oryza sativa Japonica Group]|uniref:Os08g0392300 protein n=1 Tax=Oryza sativa subsp. japonica TaxID=39947 RepID=Q0J5X2_ORYSJ|nr:Os08g0392300 [Oryza sativa Japonica Group]|eukprot:NP_001061729.1 Os08g0392300 [Oryza sativa Japonica Group]
MADGAVAVVVVTGVGVGGRSGGGGDRGRRRRPERWRPHDGSGLGGGLGGDGGQSSGGGVSGRGRCRRVERWRPHDGSGLDGGWGGDGGQSHIRRQLSAGGAVCLPIAAPSAAAIPLIDLAKADVDRGRVVAEVRVATETVGFFQVVNHDVAKELTDAMLAAVRYFHEEPLEAKAPYYTRDVGSKVRFSSNYDLFRPPAANWRDTLFMEMAPEGPSPEEIPPPCRGVAEEYAAAARGMAVRAAVGGAGSPRGCCTSTFPSWLKPSINGHKAQGPTAQPKHGTA